MDAAFTLRDLSLGYKGHAALWVEELEIPAGCMVFVIGPSGIGKSTLLETIGLMSNTFLPVRSVKPEFRIGSDSFDPARLWHSERSRLADIRRTRFSFVFQTTNLMPNFSIGENIRMAVQGATADPEDLDERIGSLLESLELPRSVLERASHELSGGQRQRIAFIRALVKDFSVLLADEPTGNLDLVNSVTLFRVLKQHLAALGRTAVIVTHHVGLAEEFGDHIVEIVRGAGAGPANVHFRNMAAHR